jgi:hypothetical protein
LDPQFGRRLEQIARAKAVQAVPIVKEKFVRTQDELDKARIASALGRLWDTSDIYWDYNLSLRQAAAELWQGISIERRKPSTIGSS